MATTATVREDFDRRYQSHLKHLKLQGLQPKTIDAYARGIHRMGEYFDCRMYWVRFFIRWHARDGSFRHPRDMGAEEVRAFLIMLTTERRVAVSTHNQALSALLCKRPAIPS